MATAKLLHLSTNPLLVPKQLVSSPVSGSQRNPQTCTARTLERGFTPVRHDPLSRDPSSFAPSTHIHTLHRVCNAETLEAEPVATRLRPVSDVLLSSASLLSCAELKCLIGMQPWTLPDSHSICELPVPGFSRGLS
jgi:hypothetical protein